MSEWLNKRTTRSRLCRKSKVPDFAFYKNIDKGIFDHNFFLGVCGNFNKLIYKSSNAQRVGVLLLEHLSIRLFTLPLAAPILSSV